MKFDAYLPTFSEFLDSCPREPLDPHGRYLFLSDLHMGNGGGRDDLSRNRFLIESILERWYLKHDYTLVMNGDIEEMQKFRLPEIQAAWPKLLGTVDEFAKRGKLRKIIGNHDYALLEEKNYPWPLYPGLIYESGEDRIAVFHGHQSSDLYNKYEHMTGFLIRYLVKPLHIRNSGGLPKDARRRFAKERRIYRAARKFGVLAVTGHTHHPLFESMSKFDNIRFMVEDLMREYAGAENGRKAEIEESVMMLRREMSRLSSKKERRRKTESLYGDSPFLVPCLFNSGCATGKHGITALEIVGGFISLVYWTVGADTRPYISRESRSIDFLDDDIWRYTIHEDRLETIFARLKLLGGELKGQPYVRDVGELEDDDDGDDFADGSLNDDGDDEFDDERPFDFL